jgi:hypothetical protein
MATTERTHQNNPVNRYRAPGKRWPIILSSVVGLLLAGLAASYLWLLPELVHELVRDLESSASRILSAPIRHGQADLEGLDRLVITDLVIGQEDQPLLTLGRVEVELAPLTLTDGLPTVLLVSASDVTASGRIAADGSDNFSAVAASLLAYFKRAEGKEGGQPGLLLRLLRQTPAIRLSDVTVRLDRAGKEAPESAGETLFHLIDGQVAIENPNLALQQRAYMMDARFRAADGPGVVSLECDFDFASRALAANADFDPPMGASFKGNRVEVEQLRYRSSEYLEVRLGRIALLSPFASLEAFKSQVGGLLVLAGQEPMAARLESLEDPVAQMGRLQEETLPRLAKLKYPETVWRSYMDSLRHLAEAVADRVLAEADAGEYFVLDGARILYLYNKTRSGTLLKKLRISVAKGEAGGGELRVLQNPDTSQTELNFEFVSPSEVFDVSGTIQKAGEALEGKIEIAASIPQPSIQLQATLDLRGESLSGELRGQVRSVDPLIAASASLLLGEDGLAGEIEGEFLVPDVLFAKSIRVSLRKGGWSADVSGTLYPPVGQGAVEIHAAVDSATGLKRFSASSEDEMRIPVGEHDLLLSRARLGRDSVLHIEDAVVVQKGADRSRAVLRVADLAFELVHSGQELIAAVQELGSDASPEQMLEKLVSSVRVEGPVLKVRQPPRIPVSEEDDEEEISSQEFNEKISDALEETSKEAVVMQESFRKALAALAVEPAGAIRALASALVKAGDRFPIARVEVTAGRFEYADAVSPQDRLLSELSNFNATLVKSSRPGSLGGRFALNAEFSTAVANATAGSSLQAEVDLATGDIAGELKVEKMALFPYRFFVHGPISLTPLSFLEDGLIGFHFLAESDRFVVWGRGRLTEFDVVSRKLSSRPLERMAAEVSLGDDEASGILFQLDQKRMETLRPLAVTLGKIPRLTVLAIVEAADPEYPKFDFKLDLPDTAVNDLLSSIPAGLSARIAGLQVAGTLGLTVNLQGNSRDLRDLKFSFLAREDGIRVEAPGRNIDFNRLTGEFAHHPPADRGKTIIVGSGTDWAPLEQISPWLVLAVTTCEDGSFFKHSGFNPYQFKMSVIRNMEKGRFARGASTISMQLVKNLFLDHEKTIARKLQEILLTWLLEKEIQKEKMIEIYLNIIEWGRGVYGIKQACDFYFDGIPPESLSPGQAAFLASFVPYPRPFWDRFRKGMKDGKRNARWEKWWDKRLKIVKRIGRAMVTNCSNIDNKCPSNVPYCRVLATTCTASIRELREPDNLKSLDELFRPAAPADLGGLGDPAQEL